MLSATTIAQSIQLSVDTGAHVKVLPRVHALKLIVNCTRGFGHGPYSFLVAPDAIKTPRASAVPSSHVQGSSNAPYNGGRWLTFVPLSSRWDGLWVLLRKGK